MYNMWYIFSMPFHISSFSAVQLSCNQKGTGANSFIEHASNLRSSILLNHITLFTLCIRSIELVVGGGWICIDDFKQDSDILKCRSLCSKRFIIIFKY